MSTVAKFKLVICNKVATKINKQLTTQNIRYIDDYINSIPKNKLDVLVAKVDMKLLISMISEQLTGRNLTTSDYDIKEYLKSIIGTVRESGESGLNESNELMTPDSKSVFSLDAEDKSSVTLSNSSNVIETELNSILSQTEKKDLQNVFNPVARHKRKFIVLDSINQDDLVNGTGKIAWDIIPSRDFVTGCVNTTYELRNVVGIRLLPPRWEDVTPLLYMADNIARWSILIEELSAQCFLGPENRKFHFMTTIGAKGNLDSSGAYYYQDMTMHNFNHGYFWFRKPITTLRRMTLSFGCPWYVFNIKSNKIIGNASITPFTFRLLVTFPSTPTFDNKNAVLMFGDLTITGFTTSDPVTDAALIASVNGHTFTPFAYPTAYSIEFPIDLTGITLPSGQQVNIYSSNYRMTFPMEIIYLDEES